MTLQANTEPFGLDSAAEAFASLLSQEEEGTPGEAQQEQAPAPKQKAPIPDQKSGTESDVEEETPTSDEAEANEQPADEEKSEETDEEPAEEAKPEPRKFKVKVNDQEQEVTEDELLRGYLRTQDYTRKTQTVAEQRKAVDTELTQVRSQREQYSQYLTQLQQAIERAEPAEPNWDNLLREDPVRYQEARAAWDQHKTRKDALAEEAKRAADQVMADRQIQAKEYLDTERGKLLEALPTWSDPEVAKKETGDLVAFAKSAGYTEAELAQVTDHRVMLLLRKAMLFDRADAQRAAATKKVEKVKAATPGTGAKRPPVSELTRNKQRLAKTGRVEDAADVFLQLIDD